MNSRQLIKRNARNLKCGSKLPLSAGIGIHQQSGSKLPHSKGAVIERVCENTYMVNPEDLVRDALASNFSGAAVLETSSIQFHEDFRKACEKNLCRKYDTNWMGPPAIGPISALMKQVTRYRRGLLLQSMHPLRSNFDIKGMLQAAKIHGTAFRELMKKIRTRYPAEDFLPLDAGCCSTCERCAYLDREPCRHPDEAVSSVEAYGMNVIALQKSAGLPYNNGKNTVTYVGLILFEKQEVRS